jgi:oligoribonuclease
MTNALKLVWIDLEMTGLDPETDAIIEIAVVITGADLIPLTQYEAVIWQPESVLERMTPFVREMHTTNGLLAKVRASEIDLREAERKALQRIGQHCALGEGVLAGNSIHQDRRFLVKYMPQLEGYLHYRQVDVSSLKVLAQAWYPDVAKFDKPEKDHTALADIQQSIAELKHYRANVLK